MTSPKLIYNGKGFQPADPDELQRFKAQLQPGAAFRLESWEERRGEGAHNLFHKLRDRYANAAGLDKEYAKAELKYRHGIHMTWDVAFSTKPKWRGQFVEMYNAVYYMKSVLDYTTPEMSALIDGTVRDLAELGVDCSDILREAT